MTLSLAHRNSDPATRRWLLADAPAPLAGVLIAQAIANPPRPMMLLLGGFAIFFLYIGAGELLPRSQTNRSKPNTLLATRLGLTFIYALVRVADT